MDLGGGEYARQISQPAEYSLYRVGKNEAFETINTALQQWQQEAARHAVIEITDSGVYVEPINIELINGQQSLQLRAANRARPIIRLLDWQTSQPDALTIFGTQGSRFTLDGLMVTGRGVQVSGDLAELTVRHSTLVPGWTLGYECEPQRPTEPSLEIFSPNVCVKIEHSILGAIQIDPAIQVPLEGHTDREDENSTADQELTKSRCQGIGTGIRLDPIRICISDSILDATDPELEAIGAPGCPVAHACLTLLRSTVIGQIQVHAVLLGENSIFDGRVTVARRQKGCLRFCYVTPESRTPSRYRCQPDLVERPIKLQFEQRLISETERDRALECERLRIKPRVNSRLYDTPAYCQLADSCAEEIKRGADDESEMGVFHNLYQPQRAANLRARLNEYVPAGVNAGIIHAS
jgi:hypothetical protein